MSVTSEEEQNPCMEAQKARDLAHVGTEFADLGIQDESLVQQFSRQHSKNSSKAGREDKGDTMFEFTDPEKMKQRIQQQMVKQEYDVSDMYSKTGIWQAIARSGHFEKVTLTIITFNALWIAHDTDANSAEVLIEAQVQFQAVEYGLCVYFTLEWLIRFLSFENTIIGKLKGFTDSWFLFDSCLVATMVFETWIMTTVMLWVTGDNSQGMGGSSLLRIARLMRLSRMARMARLFRAMPELLILIKGMVSATRSLFFALCLLFILLYIFAIAFVQLLKDTEVGNLYFPGIFKAIDTLLLDGALMDSPGKIVRALGAAENGSVYAGIFYVFMLLASWTVLNMLIGVLCEVVSAVAQRENEKLTVAFVRSQLESVVIKLELAAQPDVHKVRITRGTMSKILVSKNACITLTDVGVDVSGLVDNMDQIFQDLCTHRPVQADPQKGIAAAEEYLTFEEFILVVLSLRGENRATVKDIVDLRKYIKGGISKLHEPFRQFTSRESLRSATCSALVADAEATFAASPVQEAKQVQLPRHQGLPSSHAERQDAILWEQRRELLEVVNALQQRVLTFIESIPEGASSSEVTGDSGGTVHSLPQRSSKMRELRSQMSAMSDALGAGVGALQRTRQMTHVTSAATTDSYRGSAGRPATQM